MEAGTHSFVLTPKKWIESTNAIGIISKRGRYDSGTYAHPDIAFEFASWISAEFKLYLIREFERLKQSQFERLDRLNKIAQKQYDILKNNNSIEKIKSLEEKNNTRKYLK